MKTSARALQLAMEAAARCEREHFGPPRAACEDCIAETIDQAVMEAISAPA